MAHFPIGSGLEILHLRKVRDVNKVESNETDDRGLISSSRITTCDMYLDQI